MSGRGDLRAYLENLGDLSRRSRSAGPTARRSASGDVATLRFGGDIRRGLAEMDGKGETVGAIVMARYGENAPRGHPSA